MSFMVIYASDTGEHYDDNDMRLQNCEGDYIAVYRKSVACGDTWRTVKYHGVRFVFIAANRANVINITMSGACDAPAVKKKRTYSEENLRFSFSFLEEKGVQKPQCVLCMKVLSAESMKPFQLRRHFEKEHPTYKDRNISFFQRKTKSAKNARIDSTAKTSQQSKAAVEASYVVSLRIAKAKNAHTIGEELIFSCIEDVVRLMIGTEAVNKRNAFSISDNTVHWIWRTILRAS